MIVKKQTKAQRLGQIDLGPPRPRAKISEPRLPFLEAVKRVLNDLKDFLPLSERQIHYNLLNQPPLMHALKPDSRYSNTARASALLSRLCTQALIEGRIPADQIRDETRPVTLWQTHRSADEFAANELDWFLTGYRRDLMQSQPAHIELIVEKNTVANILEPVAREFCIPMISARGFSSMPPRLEVRARFKASGKQRLILIVVSDFDPSGEAIALDFSRSMRDDFGIEGIKAYKAALTCAQVVSMRGLPQSVDKGKKASEENRHLKPFIDKYGAKQGWYELEAVPPRVLQDIVRKSIKQVMDKEAFAREAIAMAKDIERLARLSEEVSGMLKQKLNLDW